MGRDEPMNDTPVVELGLGALAFVAGVSLVLWWVGYLVVRWIVT